MATKEEHLADLVSANIEKSGAVARTTFGWLQQLSEALAERDAAKEDSRLTLEEHMRVVAERDAALAKVAGFEREKLPEALHNSIAVELDCSPSVSVETLIKAAMNRIGELKSAPRPEPAPVVGGVTEDHLDAIARASKPKSDEYIPAFARARAAIRAQKRVDVEAIRKIARYIASTPRSADSTILLRAIGDVPSEAPASAPQAEPQSDASLPVLYLRPDELPINVLDLLVRAQFAESTADARRLVEMGAVRWTRGDEGGAIDGVTFMFHLGDKEKTIYAGKTKAAVVRKATPQAEPDMNEAVHKRMEDARSMGHGMYHATSTPPAPAGAEGPFIERGVHVMQGSVSFARTWTVQDAKLAEKLLNLGWQAEQGRLVKPPETREEKLRALVDLAWELGEGEPSIFGNVAFSIEVNTDERAMLRAHLAKRKAAESANGGES